MEAHHIHRGPTMTDQTTSAIAAEETPLATFSRCHLGIVSQLEATAKLPELVEAAARARETAHRTLDLFHESVLPHHDEEEKELFTAVLQSALPAEKEEVRSIIDKLTSEHRAIEALWKQLEPAVRHAARGSHAEIDPDLMADLVQRYLRHARYEETEFLPMAQRILGRNDNHMAALGLSLHMRHVPHVVGYI